MAVGVSFPNECSQLGSHPYRSMRPKVYHLVFFIDVAKIPDRSNLTWVFWPLVRQETVNHGRRGMAVGAAHSCAHQGLLITGWIRKQRFDGKWFPAINPSPTLPPSSEVFSPKGSITIPQSGTLGHCVNSWAWGETLYSQTTAQCVLHHAALFLYL